MKPSNEHTAATLCAQELAELRERARLILACRHLSIAAREAMLRENAARMTATRLRFRALVTVEQGHSTSRVGRYY